MADQSDTVWTEEEYNVYLEAERILFAWCLEKYGNYDSATARDEALLFYKYESKTIPHRGLVFHDEAWHWAMLKIFGENYWKKHPELESSSKEYEEKAKELHNQPFQ